MNDTPPQNSTSSPDDPARNVDPVGATVGPTEALPAKKRWVLRTLLLILALLSIYPVVANLLLNTERGQRLILPGNDKIIISWTRAWTLLPGLVHVYDLELENTTKRLRWDLDLERTDVWINLLSLIKKSFRVHWARGRGFECGFDLLEAGEATLTTAKQRKKRPWTIDLSGIQLQDFRQCRSGTYRLVAGARGGSGSLGGGYKIQLRGPMTVSDLVLTLDQAELLRDDQPIARITHLDSLIDTDPFSPRAVKGRELLRYVTGELNFDTETNSLAFLNAFLKKAKWLRLSSGFGTLQSRIALNSGVLQPESRIAFRSEDLTIQYLDYFATGSAQLLGQVEGQRPRFAAAFQAFEVRQAAGTEPYILGQELMIHIDATDSDLSTTPDVAVQVDLPQSVIPELTIYNSYLPEKMGIELTGGTGAIEAHLSLSTVEGESEGSIELSSSDLSAASGDLGLSGTLTVKTKIENIDAEKKSLEMSSTVLDLKGVTLWRDGETLSEEWSGYIELSKGLISLTQPLGGEAELDFNMTDSRPILTFFAEKKPKLETVAKLVNIKDITGSSRLKLTRESLVLHQLEIDGRRLHVEGRLCLGTPAREGAIHVKAFGIGLGSYFVNQDRRWTLLRPRRWYEEKLAQVDCTDSGLLLSKKEREKQVGTTSQTDGSPPPHG